MAWFRKVKAGLVKSELEDYIGEVGNIFFNIETGECRLSDGVTPGGLPCGNSGGMTEAEVQAIIDAAIDQIAGDITNNVTNEVTNDVETIVNTIINNMVDDGLIPPPTIEAEHKVIGAGSYGAGTTTIDTPSNLKIGSEELYLNGLRLNSGSSNDYTIDPTTITFENGWQLYDGDVINIVYVLDN